MKKVLCISGIITSILLILLLTGWADADDAVKEALRQGNNLFESAAYDQALNMYEIGLAASPDNKALNFNAAQSAYLLGDYEKAIEYYMKSDDAIEKFLNAGNICFRSGDAAQDVNQKSQFYEQALQIYAEGILKYPQDVPLKYNYELVREKLEELEQENEQSDQEQENGEQGDQEQENSEQGDQDSQEQENNEQGSQEQESEDNGDSESTQENQEQNSEQGEASDENGEDETSDQAAIERILQMLESQEEQSLKNNQEVVGGKEGKNGW